VILVAKPESLPTVESLGELYLPEPDQQHRAGAVEGHRQHSKSPSHRWSSAIWRNFRLLPSRSILAQSASLSKAVDEVNQAEQAVHLPPSITSSFQGAAQAFKDSLSSEVYLLIAALVAVYIVLGVLYESFIHPVTILSTLHPPASARCSR